MTQTEQLQKLLDKAVRIKWEWRGYGIGSVIAADDLVIFSNLYLNNVPSIPIHAERIILVNDLLFDDNLSFLKALLGDNIAPASVDGIHPPTLTFALPAYQVCVQQLAILPPDERIPTLYKLVFHDEQ